MGIWIRSQNRKRLMLVNGITFSNNEKLREGATDPFDYVHDNTEIYALSDDGVSILGVYASEERAIEVLDEIHQAVSTQKLAKFYGSAHGSMGATDFVFEMPSE